MSKFLAFLDGKKTFAVGAAIAVVVVLQVNGLVPDATADVFYKVLGVGGLITVRHAISKATV